MKEEQQLNRREVLGGLGVLAAAAIVPLAGSEKKISPGFSGNKGIEDPVSKYRKPPYCAFSQHIRLEYLPVNYLFGYW